MTARTLADAGHAVFASMRHIEGHNREAAASARECPGDVRPIELDVSDQASVDAAVSGLLVWAGSTSTRGGTPPYLAPYFAAKAAEDSLAVSYAAELARFGIETTIVVPGSFTHGTNHFANAGHPEDTNVAAAYDERYAGLMDAVGRRLAELAPDDADPAEVARQIARVVDLPKGERPFRVHIDPAHDGGEEVNALGDRIRERFYRRIGLGDLLHPANPAL
jgi:NAD(P)-dependent dehydrogenase (short-subunit alcohol dehydrogenase family)